MKKVYKIFAQDWNATEKLLVCEQENEELAKEMVKQYNAKIFLLHFYYEAVELS